MPDHLSQARLDTYNELLEVAGSTVLKLGRDDVELLEKADSRHVWDEVDDAYLYGVHSGLKYQEIQVLAAIAVLKGADFDMTDDVLPHDRSLDE